MCRPPERSDASRHLIEPPTSRRAFSRDSTNQNDQPNQDELRTVYRIEPGIKAGKGKEHWQQKIHCHWLELFAQFTSEKTSRHGYPQNKTAEDRMDTDGVGCPG